MAMHEAVAQKLRYFEYSHLPLELQEISKKFGDLASDLAEDDRLTGPELTVCLTKLLEAKDAAVRAAIY